MPTLLFVHGTGVRQASYGDTLRLISETMGAAAEVQPCYWGDLGSRLGASGQSIPAYDSTRSGLDLEADSIDPQSYPIALWQALLVDPLHELRSLGLKPHPVVPAFQQTQGQQLIQVGRQLELSEPLRALLLRGGIEPATFDTARREVLASQALCQALEDANEDLDEYRAAIARAWIATAANHAHAEKLHSTGEWWWPALVLDVDLRTQTEKLLIEALGGEVRSVTSWVMHHLSWPLRWGFTQWGTNRRGAISDAAYPAAGDIMLYQARGEAIRARIRDHILAAAEPVHLLAHSLGGVACVDLLATEALPVQQLITVGSQAPFLYEINALPCLPFGHPLPASLPPWLNIYDRRDFLSYIGASVFPGRIVDRCVDNRQAFPASHSAYWWNAEVWEAIRSTLPR
jgi:hypothetical protein